jgi:hypothetical protein
MPGGGCGGGEIERPASAVSGWHTRISQSMRSLPDDQKETLTPEIIGMIPDALWAISAERSALLEKVRDIDRSEIQPAMIIAAVVSIAGIESEDGGKYTAQMLCDAGPDTVFDSVAAAIAENGYLERPLSLCHHVPCTESRSVGRSRIRLRALRTKRGPIYKRLNCRARRKEWISESRHIFLRPLHFRYEVESARPGTWAPGYNIEVDSGRSGTRAVRLVFDDAVGKTDECPKSVLLRIA